MTLLSLTDCCRLLALDAKTLRRWLAQAQLSPQPHPTDARRSAITADELRLLAIAHHRRLPPLADEFPVPAPTPSPPAACPLPPELLALLQTLSALPAQLAAVQQQLAALTARLAQPAVTARPAEERPARRRSRPRAPTPVRSPSATAAAPKPARSSAHVVARVEYVAADHYIVLCPKEGLLPLTPDTPEWFAWLATQSAFRFVGKAGHFSAHHEWRVPRGAWRAHRHIRNHGYSLRLAPTPELTIAVLEQAAEALQAHLK
jgi:hypothetical protein